MNKLPVTEADLHAYVDGMLPPERRREVDTYLSTAPAAFARVRAYREQNEALRALFDPVLDEPVPARLSMRPAVHPRGGENVWSRYGVAASVAFLAVSFASGAGGWALRGALQPNAEAVAPATVQPVARIAALDGPALPRRAAVAHVVYSPDVRRPVEIAADQESQLVAWLSKRLGTTISVPKLGGIGYELIGGRLLPGSGGPVAQFMYHDATGQRLTLYVTTEIEGNRDTGFRFAREGPVNVFYWVDGKFGYALSAGVDKGELARVATVVYDQLEGRRR
jgi:anti-sigma factor RsiW